MGKHKHGIFKTERELYHKVVEKCNLETKDKAFKRHPLAFLVEAADTICYGTMDVEDGLLQHWYGVTELLDILIKYFFHPSTSYHLHLNGIISESRMAVAMKEDLSDEYPKNKVISQDEICDFDVGRLSPYARLRMIVDFVASMTDKYSVELYQTLSGNSS